MHAQQQVHLYAARLLPVVRLGIFQQLVYTWAALHHIIVAVGFDFWSACSPQATTIVGRACMKSNSKLIRPYKTLHPLHASTFALDRLKVMFVRFACGCNLYNATHFALGLVSMLQRHRRADSAPARDILCRLHR